MSMTMEVSVWNQDFWVEESKIVRFEQMKNFNDPLNPDNPEKLVFKKKDYDNRSKNGKSAFLVESSKIGMFEPKKNLNTSERSNNPENKVRLCSFLYI